MSYLSYKFGFLSSSDKSGLDHRGKVIVRYVLAAASVLGFVAAAAMLYHGRKKRKQRADKIVPLIGSSTESGRAGNLERFSHYVARQMGFDDPPNECPQLCKLAYDYLRKSKGCEDDIFYFFASHEAEDQVAESLSVKLIEEFERCILTYFAFHWSLAPLIISQQAVNATNESEKKSKLKHFVMAATRKQRIENITETLKVTRVFSNLVEEMKVIRKSECTDVMKPMAPSERSPVLLLMGGGMGAGKSTVIKDIMNGPFWSEVREKAVVVDADAFRESDVIFKALNSMGDQQSDLVQTSELVHQPAIQAAASLLVTALNDGKDVILDGTLSWEPFVSQTIKMVRDVHRRRYRIGPGYIVAEDGTVSKEEYWEPEPEPEGEEGREEKAEYRIELVGVVCDPYLAVARGMRRAIEKGRAVRVKSQLKSHKRFAQEFQTYCKLVDSARLYCTNAVGGPPKLIAFKNEQSDLLIDVERTKCLSNVSGVNTSAESIYELYPEPSPICEPGSVWSEVVMNPSRPSIQLELKNSIQQIEGPPPTPHHNGKS